MGILISFTLPVPSCLTAFSYVALENAARGGLFSFLGKTDVYLLFVLYIRGVFNSGNWNFVDGKLKNNTITKKGDKMNYGLFIILGLFGVTFILSTIIFKKSMKE